MNRFCSIVMSTASQNNNTQKHAITSSSLPHSKTHLVRHAHHELSDLIFSPRNNLELGGLNSLARPAPGHPLRAELQTCLCLTRKPADACSHISDYKVEGRFTP
mmetsp:Transcript_17220/g.25907  ORF Transcript_17220/g.25907 Transcript_17220/m.25907 type:complete len:104 (+) Transcript_17220:121-432(+)